MITPIIGRLLMGKSVEELRRKSRPLPQWVIPQGASLADGNFEVVDDTPAPAPAAVSLEVVDQDAARLLADEAKRLAVPR